MQQAWHFDTPLPGVFVNILYLDNGQRMTQFMTPKGGLLIPAGKDIFSVPHASGFLPLGEDGRGYPIISEEWREYLRKKFVFFFFLSFF
jgi:hypothetical protein